MFVYSFEPLILKYHKLSEEELGFEELENEKIGIGFDPDKLERRFMIKIDNDWIPYEDQDKQNLLIDICTRERRKIQEKTKSCFDRLDLTYFDVLIERLQKIDTLEVHLKKYLCLINGNINLNLENNIKVFS